MRTVYSLRTDRHLERWVDGRTDRQMRRRRQRQYPSGLKSHGTKNWGQIDKEANPMKSKIYDGRHAWEPEKRALYTSELSQRSIQSQNQNARCKKQTISKMIGAILSLTGKVSG